jgi:hypothetical protein
MASEGQALVANARKSRTRAVRAAEDLEQRVELDLDPDLVFVVRFDAIVCEQGGLGRKEVSRRTVGVFELKARP